MASTKTTFLFTLNLSQNESSPKTKYPDPRTAGWSNPPVIWGLHRSVLGEKKNKQLLHKRLTLHQSSPKPQRQGKNVQMLATEDRLSEGSKKPSLSDGEKPTSGQRGWASQPEGHGIDPQLHPGGVSALFPCGSSSGAPTQVSLPHSGNLQLTPPSGLTKFCCTMNV